MKVLMSGPRRGRRPPARRRGSWLRPRSSRARLVLAYAQAAAVLAPITARLMTDWITAGKLGMSVTEFLPDRFLPRPAK